MNTAPIIHEFSNFQGQPARLLARVQGLDGLITQAQIDSILCHVFDSDDPDDEGVEQPIVVADAVEDELQLDDKWRRDSIGYNFIWTAPGLLFPLAGKRYRIEIIFTPSEGEDFAIAFINNTLDLRSMAN